MKDIREIHSRSKFMQLFFSFRNFRKQNPWASIDVHEGKNQNIQQIASNKNRKKNIVEYLNCDCDEYMSQKVINA